MDASTDRKPFRFKRFEVSDRHSSMKIGTDGVLLGAWCGVREGDLVWDVGAGTGLISLMTLQRGAREAVAFEISGDAVCDIRENTSRSPWSEGISVVEGDFSELWRGSAVRIPDLIVSNPPFFTETLRSPDSGRALARHESSLTFGLLFDVAAELLELEKGRLCVVAPAPREEELVFEASLRRLSLRRIASVRTTPKKPPRRILLEFTRGEDRQPSRSDLMIHDENGNFSEDYKKLTGDFYLNF